MLNELDGDLLQWKLQDHEAVGPLLNLARCGPQDALTLLASSTGSHVQGVDMSMMDGPVDMVLTDKLVTFCADLSKERGCHLRLSHNDLSSGSDCEQRIFDLVSEKKVREAEKVYHEKRKTDSSKEKDFAAAAGMKRKAQENIDVAMSRLAAIDEELKALDERKVAASWHSLFASLKSMRWCTIAELDLSDCCLHATSIEFLTIVLMELEQRGDGQRIKWLALDGNDLGDVGMGSLARLLKLSGHLQTLLCRNVGITERGVSEIVAGLVSNKSLALLDLRNNGLCERSAAQAAIDGVQRFNKSVEVLL
mmetsp:Transcript_21885/g.40248  ORF Transcript_21885/g.40248 Transcript_21885/m.40248 type:complete len:308 (-) Transcript_21885:74-997(-)